MKVIEFLKEVEKSYKKEFPRSIIIAQLNKGLGKSIYIKCYLAGNKEEFINRIPHNDLFSITFWGHNLDKNIELDSELPNNFCLICDEKSYLINPTSQYLCYSRKKLNYRKTIGAEKSVKTLDNFFKKLKQELLNDIKENNIPSNYLELLKEKILTKNS